MHGHDTKAHKKYHGRGDKQHRRHASKASMEEAMREIEELSQKLAKENLHKDRSDDSHIIEDEVILGDHHGTDEEFLHISDEDEHHDDHHTGSEDYFE